MKEQKLKCINGKNESHIKEILLEIDDLAIKVDTLIALHEEVELICYKYFPDCNAVLIHEFNEYARGIKLALETKKILIGLVNKCTQKNCSKDRLD